MKLKRFYAKDFRNIEECDISFSDNVNLLLGENAQGKTNVLEGIYLFARGRSFRTSSDKDLIRFGQDGFRIGIEYEDKNGINSLEYALFGTQRRRMKNGYRISKVSEMLGNFRAVIFEPGNLSLVKGNPEERRNFLNICISQIKPVYVSHYQNYQKALDNRNRILKNAQKGLYYDNDELISWSLYCAEYAAYIYLMRKEILNEIKDLARDAMYTLSSNSEELSLGYESNIEGDICDYEAARECYNAIFTENLEKEKIVGVSLYGIQRDDIDIKINGKDAKGFASQGQTRSVVLALKIAEGGIIKKMSGEEPVYLFDDVMSELDERRKRVIFERLSGKQLVISSCERDCEELCDSFYEVKAGKYVSTHR